MRFDSYDHVAAYAKDGSFPAIHDDIFMLIQRADTSEVPERGTHRTYLDLGCCYGLLTARIATKLPYAHAIGIDSNPHYIRKAIDHYSRNQHLLLRAI
jgi:tRNA G46 methylase TrmB